MKECYNDYYQKNEQKLGLICNLIKPKTINYMELPYLEVRYLRNQIPCNYKKEGMLLHDGDTVILVDGENSGEIFHIKEDGYMGSTFMKLIMSEYVFKPYIEMFITKNRQYLKDNKKGSAIPHLNKNLFYNLNIILPSLEKQELIYDVVKSLSLQLNQITEELN